MLWVLVWFCGAGVHLEWDASPSMDTIHPHLRPFYSHRCTYWHVFGGESAANILLPNTTAHFQRPCRV